MPIQSITPYQTPLTGRRMITIGIGTKGKVGRLR